MSRRRKNTAPDDSMDMMLDTITNAFGGIVLLALLVTLILGQQKIKPANSDSDTHAKIVNQLESELEQRAFERDQLLQSVEAGQNQLNSFQEKDSSGLIAQLIELQKREQELNEELGNDHQQSLDIQSQIDSLAQLLNKTRGQIASASADLSSINAKLDEEKKRRTRSMDTPREAATTKRMSVVLVKNSRMHVADKSFGTGQFEINVGQFAACDESKADLVMLPPHGSVQILPNSGVPLRNTEEIERQIKRFPVDQVHLVIVVWNDSFEEFGNLRNACVSSGLEHKILPIAGGPVVEGRSASAATAQ